MTAVDLRFAAELHRRWLGHGLFPALGPRFLRCYLRTFLPGQAAVALVAEVDGAAAGFLVGVFDERTHLRGVVRQHGLRLAATGLIALAARPRVAWRFARTRLRRYVGGLGRLARSGRSVDARLPASPSPSCEVRSKPATVATSPVGHRSRSQPAADRRCERAVSGGRADDRQPTTSCRRQHSARAHIHGVPLASMRSMSAWCCSSSRTNAGSLECSSCGSVI